MKFNGINNKISRFPKRLFVICTASATATFCISFIMNGVSAPIPNAQFLSEYRQCYARRIDENKILPADQRLSPLEIQIGCQGHAGVPEEDS